MTDFAVVTDMIK